MCCNTDQQAQVFHGQGRYRDWTGQAHVRVQRPRKSQEGVPKRDHHPWPDGARGKEMDRRAQFPVQVRTARHTHAHQDKPHFILRYTRASNELSADALVFCISFHRSYLDSDKMKKSYVMVMCSEDEPTNPDFKAAHKNAGVQQDRRKHIRFQVQDFSLHGCLSIFQFLHWRLSIFQFLHGCLSIFQFLHWRLSIFQFLHECLSIFHSWSTCLSKLLICRSRTSSSSTWWECRSGLRGHIPALGIRWRPS